jgi:uncharacterized protein
MTKIYFVLGVLAFTVGVVGIILPLLPTTPFILLSAYFFGKSSNKLHNYLLTHKTFGPIIIDYSQKKALSIKIKLYAIFIMWLFLFPSIIFFVDIILVKVLLAIIGISVTVFLYQFPTIKEE